MGMTDGDWMVRALELAGRAAAVGEVPVGALLVRDGMELGAGWNRTIGRQDPSAHAEIVALRAAGQGAGNHRLPGATLYCTLEPCVMCVGALVQARVARVVFGAGDPKGGALGGRIDLMAIPGLFNHRFLRDGGVLSAACAALLHSFFQARR